MSVYYLNLCIYLLFLNLCIDFNFVFVELVYVIARAGVKFGINFTSCSENSNFSVIATTSGIYSKFDFC